MQDKTKNLDSEQIRHAVMTNGPIGRWSAVPGTHLMLMDAWINFSSDGSGRMTAKDLNGEWPQDFHWRMAAYGVLQCQLVCDPPEIGSDGQPEEQVWFNLPMVIEFCSTDTGTYWVLREQGRKGFWDSFLPLVPEECCGDTMPNSK